MQGSIQLSDSGGISDLYTRMVAEAYDAPVNAKINYQKAARKHGIPDLLIDHLIQEYAERPTLFDYFEKVAGTTDKDFWNTAVSACKGSVSELVSLHFTLCQAGNDVYDGHESESKKKQEVLDSIDGLQALLRDYCGSDTKNLGISALLGFAPNECKAFSPEKLNNQKRQCARVRNANTAILDSSLTDPEDKAGRLIQLHTTPSPYDLLDCLKAAIRNDFKPNHSELVDDPRPRLEYNPRCDKDARIKWMMQGLIEWFLQFRNDAPKKEIIRIATATAFQRLGVVVKPTKIDGAYRSAGTNVRKRERTKLT